MSESNNATCSNDAYAIGSTFDGVQYLIDDDLSAQPPTDCTPYSGDSSNSISAAMIEKVVVNDDNSTTTVTGVEITYSGGTCNSGGAASFSIKSWCDPSLSATDTEYDGMAYGDDVCN